MSVFDFNNQPKAALSIEERLTLIKTLNGLPDAQFNELIFAIEAPPGIIPGATSATGNRASELLRWAEGSTGPGLDKIQEILNLIFGKKSVPNYSSKLTEGIFTVPYYRNLFFTGREEILGEIHGEFQKNGVVALLGLGGIGKTQTAVEYSYIYRNDYQAIFWIRADTSLSLENDFMELSRYLQSPQKDAQDAISTVKLRLEQFPGWLLILDGVDDPAQIKPYIPRKIMGHILLTSRCQDFQSLGISRSILMHELTHKEAINFLCKRIERAELETSEYEAAEELIKNLGFLPLALEQAGAYISAKKTSIIDYLTSYKRRNLELLDQAKPAVGDYFESITSTWSLNFSEIERKSPLSADLMRFTAFLSAHSIPFFLIVEGLSELGENIKNALSDVRDDPVILNDALEPLTRYSLIQIDPDTRSYSTHGLVQEVLKSELSQDDYFTWARRTICAISHVFPDVEYDNWSVCEALLTHAKLATKLIDELEFNAEASIKLLDRLGQYLFARGQYYEAEPILVKVLSMKRKALGEKHLDVANSLHKLGMLYFEQGHYIAAQISLDQALSTRKKLLDEESIDVASNFYALGLVYHSQGKYREAEPLFLKSSTIKKNLLGDNHEDVLTCLHELGNLYKFQGRYEEAEALYLNVLSERQKILRSDHPNIADSLNNLALLYYYQGKFLEAEPLYLSVLEIDRKNLGEEHPDIAVSFNNLSLLYNAQGRYEEAESFCLKALRIREILLGQEHPLVSQSVNNLAGIYESQERLKEAEKLYLDALAMDRHLLGSNHPDLADSLNDLAGLYCKLERFSEAQKLYEEALDLAQRVLGNGHRHVAISLHGLGLILKSQRRYVEAETFLIRAVEISFSMSGEKHPSTKLYCQDLEKLRRLIDTE